MPTAMLVLQGNMDHIQRATTGLQRFETAPAAVSRDAAKTEAASGNTDRDVEAISRQEVDAITTTCSKEVSSAAAWFFTHSARQDPCLHELQSVVANCHTCIFHWPGGEGNIRFIAVTVGMG